LKAMGWASATESYAASALYTTLASLSGLGSRIRRARASTNSMLPTFLVDLGLEAARHPRRVAFLSLSDRVDLMNVRSWNAAGFNSLGEG
jgi:hypothetical protein